MMAVGKATKSDSTIANANHHRMDGFASGIVVIGILGGRLGFRFADPIAGSLVAAIIVKAAYDVCAEARGGGKHRECVLRAPFLFATHPCFFLVQS